jgi:acyl-CoA synthetase (AMP-forming)/AMP-acid ligase II
MTNATGWTLPDERDDFGYLELWDAVALAVPERECVVQGTRRLSWADTRERTLRLGRWLAAAGLGARPGVPDDEYWRSPNDLVGVLLRNRPEYLEATIGCYRARCAPFNINYRYTAEELAYLLDDAGASVLVFGQEFGPVVTGALALITSTRPALVVVADDSGVAWVDGAQDFERVLAQAPDVDLPTASPDDVHVLYTGGTTGMPKGVMWRQRDIAGGATGITVGSVAEAAQAAPRRGWLRAFPAPPLMHGAALWFAYNAWSRGATLVLDTNPGFAAESALDLMRRERVAWLAVIGDVFAAPLVAALDNASEIPPDLSYVFSSGAALGERSWQGLRRHYPKLAIINALGSSETGPQAFQTSGGAAEFSAGPNTVVVSEDHRRILTAETPGVGWLSNGGTLPRGYLGDERRTTETFHDVQGRRLSVSGDRAAIDATGSITFLGRAANVINTGGEKVYAEEVERVLLQAAAVTDVLVVGRDSERWGQEITALVVAAEGLEDSALREYCAQHLAGYKVPKAFVRVPEIRRSPNGKPDYTWARETVALLAPTEERV